MGNIKKKSSGQKDIKILAAQYRKDFFRKMKLIIDSVCGHHIYPLIPQKILDNIYLCRCAPFKFKAGGNSKVTSKELKDTKVVLSSLLKEHIMQIPPHNLEIKLNEYYTVYYSIITLQKRLNDTTFIHAREVKEALQLLVDDTATLEIAHKQLYYTLNSHSILESDLRKKLYWYKHEFIFPEFFPAQIENVITVNTESAESISVEVDGKARPAIRVGWVFAGVGAEWLSLKPSDLGFDTPFSYIPLKVYIQSHAIDRLLERIDCFVSGVVQFNLYSSLVTPITAYRSHNSLLIEFRLFETKAGYFRADMVDGLILIRTFLFITNNGTPEGQLLWKNTGLQKLDKKYLAIDKLSTFMTSDINNNDEVQYIFQTSGCQCLLDLYDKMKPLVTKQSKGYDAGLLLKYISGQDTWNT